MKLRTWIFLIVGVALLLPIIIYAGKAFVNFFAVIGTLNKELSFLIAIYKEVATMFFYSTPTMKYITKFFIGIIGFRFFLSLFLNTARHTSYISTFIEKRFDSDDIKTLKAGKDYYKSAFSRDDVGSSFKIGRPSVKWGGQR